MTLVDTCDNLQRVLQFYRLMHFPLTLNLHLVFLHLHLDVFPFQSPAEHFRLHFVSCATKSPAVNVALIVVNFD